MNPTGLGSDQATARLVGGDAPSRPQPVLVVVSGTGHHDRAAAATTVLRRLAGLGVKVAVSADLRPRLAADVTALLESGADQVLLVGSGLSALAEGDEGDEADREGRHLQEAEVVVRLSARAGPMRAEVVGPTGSRRAEVVGPAGSRRDGDEQRDDREGLADRVRQALGGIAFPSGPGG